MPPATALLDELVDANHVLFHQGVVDGFGHVSVRDPARSDRFLLARSMAPALVARADCERYWSDYGWVQGTKGKGARQHLYSDVPACRQAAEARRKYDSRH